MIAFLYCFRNMCIRYTFFLWNHNILKISCGLCRSHYILQAYCGLEFQEVTYHFFASCFWLFCCIIAILFLMRYVELLFTFGPAWSKNSGLCSQPLICSSESAPAACAVTSMFFTFIFMSVCKWNLSRKIFLKPV